MRVQTAAFVFSGAVLSRHSLVGRAGKIIVVSAIVEPYRGTKVTAHGNIFVLFAIFIRTVPLTSIERAAVRLERTFEVTPAPAGTAFHRTCHVPLLVTTVKRARGTPIDKKCHRSKRFLDGGIPSRIE
jgi:hypothetical protein